MWVSPRCFLACLTIRMLHVFFWMLHIFWMLCIVLIVTTRHLNCFGLKGKNIKVTGLNHSLLETTVCTADLLYVYVTALFVPRAAPCAKRRDLPTVSVQDAINGCAARVQKNTGMARNLENTSCLYPWKAAQVLGAHGNCLYSHVSYSVTKEAAAGSVPQTAGSDIDTQKDMEVSIRDDVIFLQIQSHCHNQHSTVLEKSLDICVSQTGSSPCAFSVCEWYGPHVSSLYNGGLQKVFPSPIIAHYFLCLCVRNLLQSMLT